MFGIAATRGRYDGQTTRHLSAWARDYLRKAALADLGCAVAGVFTAAKLRFGNDVTATYVALSLALPVLWIAALWLAGGYDVRFIGTGSDEFRKVLNAGVSLTAAIAIFSYAVNIELSRSYLVIALPSVTLFDLVARYAIRKRLHRLRASGRCLLSVGLTLPHVDHPQLEGFRLAVKDLFDRCGAAAALIMLAPLMAVLAAAIWFSDRGSALFTQIRVGKNGRMFRIYKFRTMVVDAEQHRAELLARNDLDGILFKLRKHPRVTSVGGRLRRWSIDELPQLVNVVLWPYVAGRSASGHPGRGREVCRACPSAAGGQARPYRSVAGQRAIGSVLG
jgi:hypothetical protein